MLVDLEKNISSGKVVFVTVHFNNHFINCYDARELEIVLSLLKKIYTTIYVKEITPFIF